MKIFISHSSKDKWAARRISQELEGLGASTFLDEKDIKTGESIDDKIQEHLHDSDDLLILVSPSSVESQWVLIELGGALALKKNVIPIFLYVGANEIPKPIGKLLGRDINDIEKYYAEVSSKITGKKIKVPKTKKVHNIDTKFKEGDMIRLPLKPIYENTEPGWTEEMDRYVGIKTRIVRIGEPDGVPIAWVDADNQEWEWALSWIVKIEE
ncbi:toll/interleukin-1 receptor domain-containing protein [Gracilimonas sp.]|uniref:toll/interleukin-1 receptor domain-containing protein n=1 Tax=Gracilimonas sp. TaxID=1974203 RepID=UPI003D153046